MTLYLIVVQGAQVFFRFDCVREIIERASDKVNAWARVIALGNVQYNVDTGRNEMVALTPTLKFGIDEFHPTSTFEPDTV